MINLSVNSVEEAQETCLYLENPNSVLNNTLDTKTEMTEGEGMYKIKYFFLIYSWNFEVSHDFQKML